ncbi:MAG TPA: acyl-CoA dehydrogenase family protein, partial [Acidimicrobiales bacterium]|nr:acyl-CoA dehydrogenase family protein [Acidimicrobiales bacterium]
MPIALSEDHEAQRRSARRWLARYCPPAVPRALLDAADEELQPCWAGLADQGWLGIHLPEDLGGQGGSLFELAVLLEETGWSVLPGPFLPTVAASALLAEVLSAQEAKDLLPALIDGSRTAAVAFGGTSLRLLEHLDTGGVVVAGTLRPLLGGGLAWLVLAPAVAPTGETVWCALELDDGQAGVSK